MSSLTPLIARLSDPLLACFWTVVSLYHSLMAKRDHRPSTRPLQLSTAEYVVNPFTMFYDDRCHRWVDVVASTGAWRFISRAQAEQALADIDRFVVVATFVRGLVRQHELCTIERLRLPR